MEVKSALTEAFVKYILPVLATAIAALITALLGMLTMKLKGDAMKAKAEGKNTVWLDLASRASHLTQLVVTDIQNTLRPMLLTAGKDGKISKEEGEEMRAEAIKRVKAMLGEHGMKELGGFVGDLNVDQYIGSLVESALGEVKVIKAQEKASEVAAKSITPFSQTPGGLPMPPSDP